MTFRPAVVNEPVPASLQNCITEVDSSSLLWTADSAPIESQITDLGEREQLLATIHRRSSGGSGKPAWKNNIGYYGSQPGGGNPSARQQTAPDRFAVGLRQVTKQRHDAMHCTAKSQQLELFR